MIAFPYPPIVSAGVFRTARFIKYLPEFGWNPLVLAVRADRLPPAAVDVSLHRLVPEDTIVERTSLWRPYEHAAHWIKQMIPRLRRMSLSPGEPEGARHRTSDSPNGSPAVAEAGRTAIPFWKRQFVQWRDLCFSTPDGEIGWFWPALVRGIGMIRRYRPDVLYSTGPPHSAHLIGIALKQLTGVPIVVDLRDPWGRVPWLIDRAPTLGSRASNRLEAWTMRKADRVVLNTEPLRTEFIDAYPQLPPEKFVTISNGFDPELHGAAALVTRNGSPSTTFRLCHAGAIYGRRDLRPLLQAIRELRALGGPVEFEQIGYVDDRESLEAFVRSCDMQSYVRFTPQLPHDQTLQHLAHADILIVIQPGTGLQIPSKIFELLALRRPILALTHAGATYDLVRQFDLGEIADPNHPADIGGAICRLQERATTSQHSPHWDAAWKTFDGRELTLQLSQVLQACGRRPANSTKSVGT